MHILLNGIGFVLKDSKGIRAQNSRNDSGLIDEEFHKGKIDKQKIIGIITNKELLNKKISELRILEGIGKECVDNTCTCILKFLQENGKEEVEFRDIDTLIRKKKEIKENSNLDFMTECKLRDNIIKEMDIKMGKYIEQYFQTSLKRDNIFVKDVIDFYNKDKLPLYDETGKLIDERYMFTLGLKKELPTEKDTKLKKPETTTKFNFASKICNFFKVSFDR